MTAARVSRSTTILALATVTALAPLHSAMAAAATQRTTVRFNGVEANRDSYTSDVSANGEFVTFSSEASNIVRGDDNHDSDVFLYHLSTGKAERISVRSNGDQANGLSSSPSISRNGRFVAFESGASNLAIKGDHNGAADVFVHDRVTGMTNRVSIRSRNGEEANASSGSPVISDNGRFVAFQSFATNLALLGDHNRKPDVFVYDRKERTTNRVSLRSSKAEANDASYPVAVSNNGNIVAYTSYASNLVTMDTNNSSDVFVYNRTSQKTTRVNVASDGAQANDASGGADMTSDGRYVVFFSYASNLIAADTNEAPDVFVHDTQTGTTERVSEGSGGVQGNGESTYARISEDGRYVAFVSSASNLVANDTNGTEYEYYGQDVFVHDRSTGTTTRESVAGDGTEANGPSYWPAISADGGFVTFASAATNLVPEDTNKSTDVFLRGPIH